MANGTPNGNNWLVNALRGIPFLAFIGVIIIFANTKFSVDAQCDQIKCLDQEQETLKSELYKSRDELKIQITGLNKDIEYIKKNQDGIKEDLKSVLRAVKSN